jgi:hypothetical protein
MYYKYRYRTGEIFTVQRRGEHRACMARERRRDLCVCVVCVCWKGCISEMIMILRRMQVCVSIGGP